MKRFLLPLLLLIPLTLAGEKPYLSSTDVRPLMDQLFEYHIDLHALNSDVVKRSFKVYLHQFDPANCYLLLDEVSSYIYPTDSLISSVIRDYQNDRFATYFTLDKTIRASITRARGWRQEWEADAAKLVAEAKKVKGPLVNNTNYASSKRDLKQRHYQRLLHLVAFQLKEQQLTESVGMEDKLVALCEKQIVASEESYLGFNDVGSTYTQKELEHNIILRTIKSLAYSLDAHTAYFSPEEAYAMKVQLEKGMCGIGVVLREGIDGILVHEMLPDGPAKKSGKIQVGDLIAEVDGEPIQGSSFAHVLEIMRGGEGSSMTLGLLRKNQGGEPQFFRVELKRKQISLESARVDVSSEPFGDGIIGKITLYSFYEGEGKISSENDLKAAIDQLKKEGTLHGLVLDLRDNCGGFLSQAIKVSGLFISNGVVVISKYSNGLMKYYRVIDGQKYYDGPLVILVSKGSASAAEIVAQALQDYGVAIVVGDEQTYGKGTIQHQTVTDDEKQSFFKVTVGRYYTTSGRSTQVEGVKADIVVPSQLHFAEIGERYLEFPLPPDRVDAAFEDPLTDIDPFAKRWFSKYYLPSLQKKESRWVAYLPALKKNSNERIARNKNYQQFLKEIKEKVEPKGSFGQNDLQLEESVNILKEMIYFSSN